MLARRAAMGVMLGGMAASVAACGIIPHRQAIRYRVTMSVETPSGLRSASSVIEASLRRGSSLWGAMDTGGGRMTGQAVAVDLGPRGALFALLNDPMSRREMREIVFQAVEGKEIDQTLSRAYHRSEWPDALRELKRKEVTGRVLPENHPMLLWLPQIYNPAAAQEVRSDMIGVIGMGYRFAGLTFAVVDDDTPIDLDLPERYPVLFRQERGTFGPVPEGSRYGENLVRKLRPDCFYKPPA